MKQQPQPGIVKRKGMSLRARMTLSYLGASVLAILLLEFLFLGIVLLIMIPRSLSQTPGAGQANLPGIPVILGFVLMTGLFWIVILSPAGALFGAIFTHGLVKRIRRLIVATARFASGDYTQRIVVTKRDEIGQLEQQFNEMAEQLIESIKKQHELVEHNARMEERARMEQELQTARLIQHSLLPKTLPRLAGWQITTYYQPAREVGGDLYDFLTFEDGRLGLVIGDVTDKGVPAAIVMASTRSMLQAAAQGSASPGEVLARVNNLLYANTPARMFVTCFYAILDPKSGTLRYANAGHDLPYRRAQSGVEELLATGMPLGLLPGTQYEEREVRIAPGESILFYSDGLVEAHNKTREMFGFPRLKSLLMRQNNPDSLVPCLLNELKNFTGEGWEQEDDVTLVTLHRMPEVPGPSLLEPAKLAGTRKHQASIS
jgi:serine phosphatase RsbU (regulator of sigma subunit)